MSRSMSGHFPLAERRHQRPAIPGNEKEVIKQIGGILKQWGIEANAKETHASFESRVKEIAANCFNANILQTWKPFDTSVVLPADRNETLKILLHHDLGQVTKGGTEGTKLETKDLIKDKYDVFLPFPPFNFVRGGNLVLSRHYKELNLSEDEIDPLFRFNYSKRPVKDYMLDQFGQPPNEEYPSHIVRALALNEVVNGGHHCLSCRKMGCLRWNSALRSDFCNIICVECNSVYSLCCVAGAEKVSKLFTNKSHFRGSYAHFQQLRSLMDNVSHRDSKMFLLLATRSVTCERGNKLPVYAAKIMGAQPNLTSDSFSPDRIRIKSNVVFEPMLDKTAWFSVDVPDDLDVVGFSMEVFHAYFDAHAEDKPTIEPSTPKGSRSVKKTEQQVISLKKVLAQIQSIKGKQERGIVLQNWELDLLGREMKVVEKLEELDEDDGNK